MLGRSLPVVLRQAALCQSLVRQQPRRGKAIANWKRPSMEEYGVPTEPWSQVRNNRS